MKPSERLAEIEKWPLDNATEENVKWLIDRVRKLTAELMNHTGHYEGEDCWYSCPASGECCDENADTECNCGAEDARRVLEDE